MKTETLLNMLFLQSLWFAAILGAAHNLNWPALVIIVLFGLSESRPVVRSNGDLRLVLVAVLLGFMLDSAWIRLGWLEFAHNWPLPGLAPLWIVLLWAGLALTLNHSLAWLQSNFLLAAFLAGLSSPFSYLAAERLGGVHINADASLWWLGIGISWAITVPLLLWLAKQLKQLPQVRRPHV